MGAGVRKEEISDALERPIVLRTALGAAASLERLGRAARLGRVPGFEARGASGFRVEADAVPFAHELVGHIEELGGEGSRVRLELRRMGRMPLLFAVVIALTVWPGVWLTDSLMATYWSAYGRWSQEMPWLTYAWYLPITVLPLPWMWRSMTRKSRTEAIESAQKQTRAIAEAIEATGG
jgi:hypothetical protein